MTDRQQVRGAVERAPEITQRHPAIGKLLRALAGALADRLVSVMVYGSVARGDSAGKSSDLNLVVVVDRLDPGALEALTPALTEWTRAGHPLPRLLSPSIIAESVDVFPIEFHDLRDHGVAIVGENPFRDMPSDPEHLRLQCERELREKMMRLREGFVMSAGRPKDLVRLMSGSWGTFVALFRGCLHLAGREVPVHDVDVVAAFSHIAGIDRDTLLEVARVKESGKSGDPRALFLRYYQQLESAVRSVDRFRHAEEA